MWTHHRPNQQTHIQYDGNQSSIAIYLYYQILNFSLLVIAARNIRGTRDDPVCSIIGSFGLIVCQEYETKPIVWHCKTTPMQAPRNTLLHGVCFDATRCIIKLTPLSVFMCRMKWEWLELEFNLYLNARTFTFVNAVSTWIF